MKIGFMEPDSFLELLDVLCPTLPESRLSLPVALLALLGSSIDLEHSSVNIYVYIYIHIRIRGVTTTYGLPAALPLLLGSILLRNSSLCLGRGVHRVV